jgi:hypothetical protein
MMTAIGHMVIFGLPIALYFGIAVFICLLITVTTGLLLVKASYPISFAWRARMVAVTIGFVLVQTTLVTWQYFF